MVTFKVCERVPTLVPQPTAEGGHFLEQLKQEKHRRWGKFPEFQEEGCDRMLQGTSIDPSAFHPARNGFVASAVSAYSRHHNLVVRPDDVWLAITVQFGFFVNGNAEALRSIFVNHQGTKELLVTQDAVLDSADYGLLARQMSVKLKENVKDENVCNWILPSFSTTTKNDLIVSSVVLMATFKSYFTYRFQLACGIPYVTLLGTTEDWEEIHRRVDELDKYGTECRKWSQMLKMITSQFVESSKGNIDTEFWNRICHHFGGGSGPRYTSGWISAFCVFDTKGNWHGDKKTYSSRSRTSGSTVTLDYPCINDNDIPAGYLTVDVTIGDNGTDHKSLMFAGHMGYEIVQDDDKGIAPKAVWAIFLKKKGDVDA